MIKRIKSLMERNNPFPMKRRHAILGLTEDRDIPDLSKRPMMRKMYEDFFAKGSSINRLDREAPSKFNPLDIFNQPHVRKIEVDSDVAIDFLD